ncbi:MAG: GIY-YIG nuclease family protein [Nitrososphaerota archaeon]
MTSKEIADISKFDESFIKEILYRSGYMIDSNDDINIKNIIIAFTDYIKDIKTESEIKYNNIIESIEKYLLTELDNIKGEMGKRKFNSDGCVGFVYIAKQLNAVNIYKIGIAKRIENRRKCFRIGNIYIDMVASKKTYMAREIELDIHKKLFNNRIEGEWFSLTNTELELLIKAYNFNLHIEENNDD